MKKRGFLRKVGRGLKIAAVGISAGTVGVVNQAAALDWTGITLSTADVDSVMALVIAGLAALWGYRKVVKTMNKS